MAIVLPNAAEVIALRAIINDEELDVRIFQNDITPDDDTVLADFTEADFIGYAPAMLISEDFSTTPGTAGNPAVSLYNFVVSFTSTASQASQNCYGYYVVGRTSGDLRWCERFTDAPYNIVNNNDSFGLTPRIELNTAP